MKFTLIFLSLLLSNVSLAQWDMVDSADEHSIGLSLESLRSAMNGQNTKFNSVGVKFSGQRFSTYSDDYGHRYPWNTGYLSYDGKIGMISEGILDGKKYVDLDITLEAGTSGLIIIPMSAYFNRYMNNQISGADGGFGYSIGGASSDGRNFSATLMFSLGGQYRNSFLESVQPLEISHTSYVQKPGSRIKTDSEMKAETLLKNYPEEFETHKRVRTVNLFEELRSTEGFRADIQTKLIPIQGGLLSVGALVKYASSSSDEFEVENELNVVKGTETEIIDGVHVTKDKYLHSGAAVNESAKSELSYRKVDLSMNLAYNKGKIRIWVSPNYRGEAYKVISDALNIKNTRENFGVQVGIGVRGFYNR